MTQPSRRGRRRSLVALLSLLLVGFAGAPAVAGAVSVEDPGTVIPLPTCDDVEPPAECPPAEPEPEPEPEPPTPEPLPGPPPPVAAPPEPVAPSPQAAQPPRLWFPTRGTATRASRSTGRLTLARVTCWQGPCTISAPRQTTVRIDGKRYVARVLGARRTTTGQTSLLRLQLTRSALRSLDRATAPSQVEVQVTIQSPASTVDQTIQLTLR